MRLLRNLGRLLDTLDLGGWLCVLAGTAIVGVTVLAPAWLDVEQLRHENAILRRQAAILDARRQNYEGFVAAVEGDDPMLLTRLAWHHLRLKPPQSELVAVTETADPARAARIDEWMRPTASQLPAAEPVQPLPDSKLVQLIFGSARPWVLAFGGWVLLIGLLVTPRKREGQKVRGPEGQTGRGTEAQPEGIL